MEVLVSRTDRRVSRFLISILVLAVSVGILSFGYKIRHTAPPAPLASPTPTPPALPGDSDVAVAVKPDVQPILVVNPPTTEPTIDAAPAIPAAEMTLAPTTAPSADLITEAKDKLGAGDLLEARDQLNN